MASSWRQQQKKKLKQHLYDVALRLFRDQGYENTTVQQITEESEVGKGTFFNHFPSKEHVLSEWYQGITLDALSGVEDREFQSAEEAITALTDELARRAAAEPKLWDMKSKSWSDLLSEKERALDARLFAFCVEQITAGKRTGELAGDLDERSFVGTILSVLTGTGHEWTVTGHNFDLQDTLRSRIAFLFRAASAGKG